MSRLAGLLSLEFGESLGDEQALAGLAAQQQHPGFSRALIGRHASLTVAVNAVPADDETAAARCRATDADRQLFVYVDGLLFNGPQIEQELRANGTPAKGPTSAQVVLAAYAAWGDQCFPRLSGSFAVVVLDALQGRFLLVRDQFGTKNLNYSMAGGKLAFSSELKPLLSWRRRSDVNMRALLEFCAHGDVLSQETLFEGIHSVPHGHYLSIDRANPEPRLHRYYDLFDAVSEANHDRLQQGGPEKFLEELDDNLHRSIRAHMAEGGPFAIALSGGVDSGVLTAIGARYGSIQAINVSIPQAANLDERAMAEAVTRHVGVPLSVVTMSGELYRRELAHATLANEIPLWHVQNVGFYLASRRASELGARSILCGDTIGMMLSPSAQLGWRKLHPMLGAVARGPRSLVPFLKKLANALSGLPVNSAGFSWASPLALQLVDGYARSELQRRSEEKYAFLGSATRRRIHGGRLADVYQQHSRFYYRGDRLGNANGVEYRSPFGDLESLSLGMNLPFEYLVRNGTKKWSIKELGQRYIPRKIAFQKKVSWNMPIKAYLGGLATTRFFEGGFCAQAFGLSRETLQACIPGWLDNGFQLQRLVHLETWGRLFVMGESADQVAGRLAAADGRQA